MPIGRYRITHPTIAVLLQDGRRVAHMVPSGAIITIDSAAFAGDRMVDATWEGKAVMMFAQDLRSRSEVVGDE